MSQWWRDLTTRTGMAAAAGVLGVAALTTAGQAQSDEFPRAADGRPDLSGIWQAVGSAHWNIEPHAAYAGRLAETGAIGAAPGGLGIVEGGTIPYRPEAMAQRQENFENRRTEDPEAKCYLPGVPRATYMPFPFQIVQGTSKIFIAYEFASANRVIHMDPVPESPVDTWMGHSVGRWDGDSLVVDVTAFNGQTWFDRAGNHHSSALHVVERYTPVTQHHLRYEATIEDPNTFTRPWRISLPLYRRMEDEMQLLEFRCVEFSEELLYGHLRRQP